jgi:hypothetical protein
VKRRGGKEFRMPKMSSALGNRTIVLGMERGKCLIYDTQRPFMEKIKKSLRGE